MRHREYFKDPRNSDIWYKVYDPERDKTWVYQLVSGSSEDAIERSVPDLHAMQAATIDFTDTLQHEYATERIRRLTDKYVRQMQRIAQLHNVADWTTVACVSDCYADEDDC
jgi:hypothetical protein